MAHIVNQAAEAIRILKDAYAAASNVYSELIEADITRELGISIV